MQTKICFLHIFFLTTYPQAHYFQSQNLIFCRISCWNFILQASFQFAQHLYEKSEGSGAVPLTNGYGSGRPKSTRIRIPNTDIFFIESEIVEVYVCLGCEPDTLAAAAPGWTNTRLLLRRGDWPASSRNGNSAAQLHISTLYCRSGSLFSLDMDTDRDSSFTVIFLVHPYSLLPIETTCYKNH